MKKTGCTPPVNLLFDAIVTSFKNFFFRFLAKCKLMFSFVKNCKLVYLCIFSFINFLAVETGKLTFCQLPTGHVYLLYTRCRIKMYQKPRIYGSLCMIVELILYLRFRGV